MTAFRQQSQAEEGRPISANPAEAAIAVVVEAMGRLRFGDIRLTIHEGRLVQVDVTEKTRFPAG